MPVSAGTVSTAYSREVSLPALSMTVIFLPLALAIVSEPVPIFKTTLLPLSDSLVMAPLIEKRQPQPHYKPLPPFIMN